VGFFEKSNDDVIREGKVVSWRNGIDLISDVILE
jgi:hypothetical protein